MAEVSTEEFQALAESHEDLRIRLDALTAVVGAMATAQGIEYERLEECIHFSAKQLRASVRPLLLQNASNILEKIEGMKKALESKNILTFRKKPSRR